MIERAVTNSLGIIEIPKKVIKAKAKLDEMVYLGDFMDRLPSNCIFLKGATGVGGTTLAINDNNHCIIAMPTRNTVESKRVIRDKQNNIIGYNEDILCIKGGSNDSLAALRDYIADRKAKKLPIKIVCTYDQVEKLVNRLNGKRWDSKRKEYIQSYGNNTFSTNLGVFRLYIDEIHQVLEDLANRKRKKAIRGMMKSIALFNDVCCITATPVERKYFDQMDEIKHLDIIKVNYPVPPRTVEVRTLKNLHLATRKVIENHINGKAFGNAHIFVNSVNFICEVLKKIDLKEYGKYIRVVCGDNDINLSKIRTVIARQVDNIILGSKTDIEAVKTVKKEMDSLLGSIKSSINDPIKKINFYTKTAFIGADIFDEEAQQYIISDGSNKYTMVDISTTYIQILGRIRDSKNTRVIHLFSESRYKNEASNPVQFFLDKENREEARGAMIKNISDIAKISKKMLNIEEIEAICYISIDEDTNEVYFDKYLQIQDEIAYKILSGDYASFANISARLIDEGLEVSGDDSFFETVDNIQINPKKKYTFKHRFIEYCSIKKQNTLFSQGDMLGVLEASEPLLHPAYELLGEERVKQLKYKTREIKKEVNAKQEVSNIKKIYRLMSLKVGTTYTASDLNKLCEKITTQLGLSKKIRLSDYYELKKSTSRVGGIAGVTSYRIIREKAVILG